MNKTLRLFFTVSILIIAVTAGISQTMRIPQDVPTIQAGIDSAANGDTVLVAPGTYFENIILDAKNITLGSWFLTSGDTSYISQTIIDGGGQSVIQIRNTVADSTVIMGFTIQNGPDGITPFSKFQLLHNRIINCVDGVDYESGSGGVCRNNLFENNLDDGIDLDDDVDILIENNTIRNNNDDGIEMRLHRYSGPDLTVIIRWNEIYGNGEDGIQLIDYPDVSNRTIFIERNLIYDNAMAGLGCMSNGNTIENYEGAAIPEPIFLTNNVIDNHNHGVTGGANLKALNNIIVNSTVLGMKNVSDSSLVSFSSFFQNDTTFENCNIDSASIFYTDPMLNTDYTLRATSPCIDAGSPTCIDPDGTTCDIGVFYFDQQTTEVMETDVAPEGYALHANYPNPFNPSTTIQFVIANQSMVKLKVFDILGRGIATLVDEELPAGAHEVIFEAKDLPSGFYFYRLETEAFVKTRRLILLK